MAAVGLRITSVSQTVISRVVFTSRVKNSLFRRVGTLARVITHKAGLVGLTRINLAIFLSANVIHSYTFCYRTMHVSHHNDLPGRVSCVTEGKNHCHTSESSTRQTAPWRIDWWRTWPSAVISRNISIFCLWYVYSVSLCVSKVVFVNSMHFHIVQYSLEKGLSAYWDESNTVFSEKNSVRLGKVDCES